MQNEHNDILKSRESAGALLAGGHSRRMGQDKALIEFAGGPLWHRALETLQETCASVLIAGDRPDLALPGVPCFADAWPGSAMAGLHTALTHADREWVVVLPCDLPYPSPELIRRLQAAGDDSVQAVVPRTRLGREPLIACYRKSALPQITWRLTSGAPKLNDLLDELAVRYLDEPDLPAGWRRALRNINTPRDVERLHEPPPVLSFVADSGTGKTTLLERLIAALTTAGWRIGALKHDAHTFEIDYEGKDSWRLTRAGAAVTAISAPGKTALVRHHDRAPEMDELLDPFRGEVDLVLTEGFRQSDLPKIEVHRAALGKPLLTRGERRDPTLIAVAGDPRIELDVPVYALDDISGLVHFIEERFLS